jgi:hypothetical protein
MLGSFFNENEIKSFQKNDIVICTKKTRSKHFLNKAEVDSMYLITSVFINNFGTCKLFMVDQLGEQYFTTDNCVELVVSNKDFQYRNDDSVSDSQRLLIEKFEGGKLAWMDKTYVPVFGSHLYDYTGHPVLTSKDNNAVLLKKVGKDEKIWINKEMVHDHDIKLFMSSSLAPDPEKKGDVSETITFRVPSWFAEKKGFIGG